MSKEEYIEKIRRVKAEIKTAGTIHRKDLLRYVRRLEKELRAYSRHNGG